MNTRIVAEPVNVPAVQQTLSSWMTEMKAENDRLSARLKLAHEFISRWREIVDGGGKGVEGWAKVFDEEAGAVLGEGKS